MDDRDRQRSKVYAWEDLFIAPRDPSSIEFARAPGMIEVIWAEMGLRFPPKVEPLPVQARSTVGDASRLSIRLAASSPSWCLLHELAHAMTSTHDGHSDGHGPTFMGHVVAHDRCQHGREFPDVHSCFPIHGPNTSQPRIPAGRGQGAAEPRAQSAEPLRRAGGAVDQSPFLGWGLFARIASRQRYRCAGARCGVVSATMLSRSESTPGSASMM